MNAGTAKKADWAESPAEDLLSESIRNLQLRIRGARQPRTSSQESPERGKFRELELLNRITAAANRSSDPAATLRVAVSEICKTMRWSAGNAYVTSGIHGERHFRAIGAAHVSIAGDAALACVTEANHVKYRPSMSLPGLLLIDAVPSWADAPDRIGQFTARPPFDALAPGPEVAVPIKIGAEMVGALHFLLSPADTPDAEITSLLVSIAEQVSCVFGRQRMEENLRRRSLHDLLTGLPNRTFFEASLQQLFEANHLRGESGPTLIFIDLNGFKVVNDTMGHQSGDDVLVEVARRLARLAADFNATRPTLTSNEDSILLARLGGDEFTMMVNGPNKIVAAEDIARSIHIALKAPYQTGDASIDIGASIGIAHDDGLYCYADELLRDADAAMYEAKGLPSGHTVLFDQAMRDSAKEAIQTEAALRKAIEANEFELYFQPIVRLSDAKPVGLEALLRWRRNGGELVYPDSFIEIAEEKGLIREIGNWVLKNACEFHAELNRNVPGSGDLFLSVNVSSSQFIDSEFANSVKQIIADTRIDPKNLILELTESASIVNPIHTAHILETFRSWNLRIALDDFGTGYSSLGLLHNWNFDTIKIDKSFIMNQSRDECNWNIVNAILQIGNAMNLNVVAEGIETDYQLERLRDMGFALGQGYLFSKPLNAQEISAFLQPDP